MMLRTVRVWVVLCLLAGPAMTLTARAENVPANPRFGEVAQKLDAGGETYVYMNAKDSVRNIVQTLRTSFAPQGAAPSLVRGFDIADKMLESLGLYSMEDVGASAVRRPNGLYHCKSYVRIPAGRKGLLKALGGAPHPCEALSYAPEDSVLFYSTDVSLGALLEAIQTGVQESQFQEVQGLLLMGQGQADSFLMNMAGKNLTLKGLLESLGGEITFIAGLDSARRLDIPIPSSGSISAPYPRAVLMLRTRDATFYELATKVLAAASPMTTETLKDGVRQYSIPIPMPPGFPYDLRPVIAQDGQYLFLATQPEYLKAILDTKKSGKNLAGAAEYKELTADLPQQGNAFSFVSKRLVQEATAALRTFKTQVGNQPNLQETFLLKNLVENLEKMPGSGSASVRVNEAAGLWVITNSPKNQAMAPALGGVAAAGIGAAVAAPGFMKARDVARQKAFEEQQRPLGQ